MLNTKLNSITTQPRLQNRRRFALSAWALAALCAFPFTLTVAPGFAQNLPTLGDTEREELSPLMERKLGEKIMNSVRHDPDYMDDTVVSEYLNKLGFALLDANPQTRGEANFNFEFFAVRDPEINAFALPGGFIGTHSGLILMAQSESELASVLGHEIGHVSQRHIARMLGSQKLDSLIPIAAMILAALAARSSPDAAMALAMGGQGVALQRQLSFSRDAEREADRVGFQILREGGYDPTAMPAFFGRLQASTRNFSDAVPAFLRSHPLTSERIADIQSRSLEQRYRQHADSLAFSLCKARIRVLQNSSTQGLTDAKVYFDQQMKSGLESDKIAAQYGTAFVYFKQKQFAKAQSTLDAVIKAADQSTQYTNALAQTSAFASLAIDVAIASKHPEDAVSKAEQARQLLPWSRGIDHQYADALLAAHRPADAERFLREQAVLYRSDPAWHTQLAKAYAEQGKQAAQHVALAQAYAISDSYQAALLQLDIARREKDAQYFDLAVIDALEREWEDKRKEEIKDEKKAR